MFATPGLDPGGATREAGATLTPSTDQAWAAAPSGELGRGSVCRICLPFGALVADDFGVFEILRPPLAQPRQQHRDDAGQEHAVEGASAADQATGAPSVCNLSRLVRSAPIRTPSQPPT